MLFTYNSLILSILDDDDRETTKVPILQYNISIDTIPYDTGLEAPFAHSLHSVYFRKFTPCCLPRLTFEPESLRQVGKFRPTKLN